jgi:hypothetical protein
MSVVVPKSQRPKMELQPLSWRPKAFAFGQPCSLLPFSNRRASTPRMIYHAFRPLQARHVAVKHRRSMRTDFQRHVVV